MALNPTKLSDALVNVFQFEYHRGNSPSGPLLFSATSGLHSSSNAANAWANAYRIYAEDGTANAIPITPGQLDARETALAGALTTVFLSQGLDAFTLATQISTALDTFWLGLAFGIGAVILTIGGVGFIPGLTTLWTPPHTSDRVANATITAGLLAAYTTPATITVEFPGPFTFFVV